MEPGTFSARSARRSTRRGPRQDDGGPMKDRVQEIVNRYARVLGFGGVAVALAALAVDTRWLAQPVSTLILFASVCALRASPVRLSKYSYLTQSGVAAIVGALTLGPS